MNPHEFEKVIVIKPSGTTGDMIELISHAKQYGNLHDRVESVKETLRKEREINKKLSDAFKRIVLFEAASYIGGELVASQGILKGFAETAMPKLLHAQTDLMSHQQDYSQPYNAILSLQTGDMGISVISYRNLQAVGRLQSTYILNLEQVINTCNPKSFLTHINVGFSGRHIRFSIPEGGIYQKEIESNPDFADFAKKWSHLFNPAIGYIKIKSPEDVGYAGRFLEDFFRNHILVDTEEVRVQNGRKLMEQFNIENRYAGI